LEYLEGVLPRDIRDRLWPFLGDVVVRRPASARSREQVLDELLRSNESIMLNLRELRQRMTSRTSGKDAEPGSEPGGLTTKLLQRVDRLWLIVLIVALFSVAVLAMRGYA